MLELPMYLDLPITLPEVLFLMALSALFGLIVYGVIKFIRGVPSDGEGTQRRRRKRWYRNHPSSSLDTSEWTILVDGSNFAHRGDGATDVSLANLQEVLSALENRFPDAQFVVFCDANLRHKFDERDRRNFVQRVENPKSRQARGLPVFRETHGQKADVAILNAAREYDRCIVVSNDRFRDGDESTLRIGVPLLKVTCSDQGARVEKTLQIFNNPENPGAKTTIPIGTYIRRRNG